MAHKIISRNNLKTCPYSIMYRNCRACVNEISLRLCDLHTHTERLPPSSVTNESLKLEKYRLYIKKKTRVLRSLSFYEVINNTYCKKKGQRKCWKAHTELLVIIFIYYWHKVKHIYPTKLKGTSNYNNKIYFSLDANCSLITYQPNRANSI